MLPNLPLSENFFFIAAKINLGLGLFNLLPIPPLDGFNIFSMAFPSFQSIRNHPAANSIFLVLFVTGGFKFIWIAADFMLDALW